MTKDTPSGNPSGRITLIQSPQALPGQCGICGKNEDPEGFVDAQLSFEFYGALIYCSECVSEMAHLYGFITPGEQEKLEDELDSLRFEVATLRAAILNLENITDKLTSDRLRDRGYAVEPSNNSKGNSELSELSEESGRGSGQDDSETDESANESGPDDLRNTTGQLGSNGASPIGL